MGAQAGKERRGRLFARLVRAGRRIGPVRFFGGVGPLSRIAAWRDMVAGLVLASMDIPQVLGYARIAEMPVVSGLYTALLAPVAFALFSSSRHLVVAADSGTAAILAGSLPAMADPTSPQYLALVGMVALITAVLLLLARLFRLGFLADFLSRTVLVGFLTGVGIQVAIGMLGDMLGIAVASRRTVLQLWEILRELGDTSIPTLELAAVVVGVILLGRRLAPRVPVSMFLVAASCFVVIIAQSAATSRSFAARYRERLEVNADILGLAAANAVAAIGGTFVVNGSPSQTAMAEGAGARGQLAQITFAAVVLFVLLFFAAPLQYLPRCVLAAVVFAIGVRMIDIRGLLAIRGESPSEFHLSVFTAVAVAAAGVEQGVLLAVALSLLAHVRHSYSPHTMVLQPDPAGGWLTVPARPGIQTEPGLILYRYGADLFYANADRFADEVRALVAHAPDPVRWFIIEAAAITDLDYSAARSLRDLLNDMAPLKVNIAFARVGPFLRADMQRHGIDDANRYVGIFPTLHEALATARKGPETE